MPGPSSNGSVRRTQTVGSTPKRSARCWKPINESRRIDMKQLLASVAMVLLVTARLAVTQEPTIDWSRTAVAGAAAIPGQGPGGAAALQLRSPAAGASFHLVTIDHPAVAAPGYAVTGELRYDAVEGQGYLEMWSVFPDSGHFFSRTLAPAGPGGPLAVLHGDSKWR